MGIISWNVLGPIAGFIGSKIINRQGQGFWLDIALGIVGALVGGFPFDLFGASGVTDLNIYSIIVAIVGSIVVLLVHNAVKCRRRAQYEIANRRKKVSLEDTICCAVPGGKCG
jgi:uncharacterized membrane protein YeaQ/YmgE (transglycosylase-associated protein family)